MRQDYPQCAEDLSPEHIRTFQKTILAQYRRHGRDLPWRSTADPYRILLSEVMLQQTQVDRVAPKYQEFLNRFPDPAALAGAPLQQVLAAWSGLGYNRRAKALKSCAEALMARHGGILPDNYDELVRLPGIGPYTARAVRVFAFNRAEVVLETNIRSVYIHFFFPESGLVRDADLFPLIDKTIYRRNPRRWYNALMDYGAALKKACGNPSRRSSGHVRQGPFENSNRQLRGALIRILLEHACCSEADLIRHTRADAARVRLALSGLAAEGLITGAGSKYSIA